MEAVRVETTKKRVFCLSFQMNPSYHYLKKEEDCALGSWTILLLTTLPSVRPGPVGEAAFWGGKSYLEKKRNEANNLGWEGDWAALLALSVELLLIEESERRLVGRWPRLGGNSCLGLPQLGLHGEKLVLEGGTRGRGALGYGRAARARGNHNW